MSNSFIEIVQGILTHLREIWRFCCHRHSLFQEKVFLKCIRVLIPFTLKFMKIKQRKSLPWRRFGYVILIITKFRELLLWISLWIINVLRSQTLKRMFHQVSKHFKVGLENLAVPFSNPLLSVWISHFLVFDILLLWLLTHLSPETRAVLFDLFSLTGKLSSKPVPINFALCLLGLACCQMYLTEWQILLNSSVFSQVVLFISLGD